MSNSIHPFEQRGLGKAPFRYVGVEVQDTCYGRVILNRKEYERTGIATTTAPGGSCAYCGTYIARMFNVESADGKRFHVGCDCIEKVHGDDPKLAAKVKSVNAKLAKAAREAKVLEAEDWITENRTALATISHPKFADRTMIDYLNWMWENAGVAGKTKAYRVAKKSLN